MSIVHGYSPVGPPPVLSVIIPTKNRSQYAIHAIRSVLSYPGDQFELIVQDNSDDNSLEAEVRKLLGSKRVIYNYVSGPLDVIDNFSRALHLATGDYITFYGDDDGGNPEVVDAAIWAKEHDVDVLTTTRPADYFWPDKQFRYLSDKLSGRLDVRHFSGRMIELDVRRELCHCLRRGGSLAFSTMPLAYRGIARRECVNRIKEQTGSYFPGLSPDLAIAVGLAAHAKKFCHVDYPLFVPGASVANVHALGRKDYGDLDLRKKAHLPKKYVENWSPYVPDFFSVPTIWGETAVQAILATNPDLIRKFSIPYLHASCLVFVPQMRARTLDRFYKALAFAGRSSALGTIQLAVAYLSIWMSRFRSAIRNTARAKFPSLWFRSFHQIEDIDGAVNQLSQYLKSTNRRFGDQLNWTAPSEVPSQV